MSATATPSPREAEARAVPERTVSDRVMAVLPLTSVYVWLCIVYLVESWNRATPWLFTDELELTQLSRSIATTGHAARRGQTHSFDSLYTYLTAPVWLIHNVASAYSGVKYLDVFVMASVVFPTYFLARLVVGRKAALFAAAAAAAIPSLAYSSYIVEETLAYPYAALCFFLIAKTLVEWRRQWKSYGWAVAAVLASLVAPAVRGELVVIPIAFAFAIFFAVWSSDWGHRRRAELDALGLARSDHDRVRRGLRGQRDRQPPLAAVVRHHDVLEAPDLRPRQLGDRLARDRARRDPARGRTDCAVPRPGRGAEP